MGFVKGLRCKECGKDYEKLPIHVCEFCFGPLEVDYDYEGIKKVVTRKSIEAGPPTMWRYKEFMPIDGEPTVGLHTGYTPLVRAKNLGKLLGLDHLYIKNDSVNHPTFSFKDRVVAVAVAKAMEFGFDTVSCASTGNLANSVAAHAAEAGLKSCIFIPVGLEAGKILGTLVYGSQLISVNGSYDDVNRLCSEIATTHPWAFVNINIRPYYAEGSKTLGHEVCEQLGWRAPDHCIVPMASGSLFTKIYKGIKELAWLGLIDWNETRMSGAQALGCSPIAEAYGRDSWNIRPQKPNTIAKSLAIGNPADGYYALKTMRSTNGSAIAVNDEEIVEGIQLLAQSEGIFAETAGGVVVSGLRNLVREGRVEPDEVVVAFITGAGLKTQEAVAPALQPALNVEANIESFEQALEEREGVLPLTKAV